MRAGPALLLALTLAVPARAEETWQRDQASYVQSEMPGPTVPNLAWPVAARLEQPTSRYDHDVLGGIPPWSVLTVRVQACGDCGHGVADATVVLPEHLVFEDVAPRLWDVTGDGRPEIVVVESDVARGARLAVWASSDRGADLSRLATTTFIGTRHRWLAPVGAGDFDGDGRIEIAYIDRPHLARELVFVRLEGNRLREVARAPGFTAHRIGDTAITSVVRSCAGQGAELLVPDGGWARLLAVRLDAGRVVYRDVGPMTDRAMTRAQACR